MWIPISVFRDPISNPRCFFAKCVDVWNAEQTYKNTLEINRLCSEENQGWKSCINCPIGSAWLLRLAYSVLSHELYASCWAELEVVSKGNKDSCKQYWAGYSFNLDFEPVRRYWFSWEARQFPSPQPTAFWGLSCLRRTPRRKGKIVQIRKPDGVGECIFFQVGEAAATVDSLHVLRNRQVRDVIVTWLSSWPDCDCVMKTCLGAASRVWRTLPCHWAIRLKLWHF